MLVYIRALMTHSLDVLKKYPSTITKIPKTFRVVAPIKVIKTFSENLESYLPYGATKPFEYQQVNPRQLLSPGADKSPS